ncbi:MAG: TolC family protein [Acidobacteriota bacterium]|nr:TolC family protein [Acidobacteriota bacterium]
MKRPIRTVLFVMVVAGVASGLFAQSEPDGAMTLDRAVARALESNPALEAAASGVSAAESRIGQAGLWPNPDLELEVENFGGGNDLRGFESAETTILISQTLPLGGAPGRRRAVAESDHALAGRDLEALRLDVIAGTTSAFYAVTAAQQRLELAGELLRLTERFAEVVAIRVEAGKISPVEKTRAEIEVATARIRELRAGRELGAARVLLAANWASITPSFDRALGELPRPGPAPGIEDLRSMMSQSPEIRRISDQVERQQRVVAFENSLRIPDLAVGAGPRRFEETGQSAWVALVGLSLPIFDRNQGERRAAEFDLERIERDGESLQVALEAELAVVVERMAAASGAAVAAETEVLPAARMAMAAVETGYREGKFAFVDVIAAQRTLLEASSLLVDSLEEYALTRTEMERLVGVSAGTATGARTDGEQQ